MEQAMIGPSPNPLILSYLKYAISSQVREEAVLSNKGVAEQCVELHVMNVSPCLHRWCLIPVFLQPSAR